MKTHMGMDEHHCTLSAINNDRRSVQKAVGYINLGNDIHRFSLLGHTA